MKTKMGLIVEIWGLWRKHDGPDYQIIQHHDQFRGGWSIMVVEEVDHAEIPPNKPRPDYVRGPRMRITLDVVLAAGGIDYEGAVQSMWNRTVAWMKPRVKTDSAIASLIEEGESQPTIISSTDPSGIHREVVMIKREQSDKLGWRARLGTLRSLPRPKATGMMVSIEMFDDVIAALDHIDGLEGRGQSRH